MTVTALTICCALREPFDYILDEMSGRIDDVMPAAFIGHGSPMNALELNRYTTAWRDFGRSVRRPRAILAVSAHWYINARP